MYTIMSHIFISSIALRQYRQMMLHLLIVTLIPTVYLPQAIHINKPFSLSRSAYGHTYRSTTNARKFIWTCHLQDTYARPNIHQLYMIHVGSMCCALYILTMYG